MSYDNNDNLNINFSWKDCKIEDENYNCEYEDNYEWYDGYKWEYEKLDKECKEDEKCKKDKECKEDLDELQLDKVSEDLLKTFKELEKEVKNSTSGRQCCGNVKIEDIKNICIKPIRDILQQLYELEARDIDIGTKSERSILCATILEIKDYLVKLRTKYKQIVMPIYEIAIICSSSISKIPLISKSDLESEEATKYEENLKKYLSKKIGQKVTINTVALDRVFKSVSGTITNVIKGIVILNNIVAIPICKIVSIEKEINNEVQNFY